MIRHQILPGSRVLLAEDVCNNFSTTSSIADLITAADSELVGIACALNRSGKTSFEYQGAVPVTSLLALALEQYAQDDPQVREDVANGNLVLKPKNEWPRLMDIMQQSKTSI